MALANRRLRIDHSRQSEDRDMICQLNPPIPLLRSKIVHVGNIREELNYQWRQPTVRADSGCSQHPERIAALEQKKD